MVVLEALIEMSYKSKGRKKHHDVEN